MKTIVILFVFVATAFADSNVPQSNGGHFSFSSPFSRLPSVGSIGHGISQTFGHLPSFSFGSSSSNQQNQQQPDKTNNVQGMGANGWQGPQDVAAHGQDAQGMNAQFQFQSNGHSHDQGLQGQGFQGVPSTPETSQQQQKPSGFFGMNLGSLNGRLPSLSSIPKPNFVSNFGFLSGNQNNPNSLSGEGKQIQNQNLIEAYALLTNELYRLTNVFVNSNATTSSSSYVVLKMTFAQEILQNIRALVAGPPRHKKHGAHGHGHGPHDHSHGPNGPQQQGPLGQGPQDPFRADLPPQFPPKQCDLKKLNNDKVIEADLLLSAKVLDLVKKWVSDTTVPGFGTEMEGLTTVDYPDQIKGLLKLECRLRGLVNGPPHPPHDMKPGLEGQQQQQQEDVQISSQQTFFL